MKYSRFALCLVLAACSPSSEKISATDAASHVGQSVTVEDVVSEVKTIRSGITFIDMGGRYPDNVFHGIIFAESAAAVGDVADLEGKTVALTGTVELYRGKPEIVLRSRDQIATR